MLGDPIWWKQKKVWDKKKEEELLARQCVLPPS